MNWKTYSSDKIKPLKIAVDSSQYEDKVEASTILNEYINQVYFSGQRKVKDDAFVLGTDLKKEAKVISVRNLPADFALNTFPEEEITQFIDAYERKMLAREINL